MIAIMHIKVLKCWSPLDRCKNCVTTITIKTDFHTFTYKLTIALHKNFGYIVKDSIYSAVIFCNELFKS